MTSQKRDVGVFRRDFLAGVVSSAALGLSVSAGSASATQSNSPVRESAGGAFTPEIPDISSDPHVVTTHGVPPFLKDRGWEGVDHDTLVASILDLDPELFDSQALMGFAGPPLETAFAYRHRAIGAFTQEYDLPHTVGFHPNLEVHTVADGWYSDLPESEKWKRPDGSVVSHPSELAGRAFDDGPHAVAEDGSTVLPSVFAPGTLDLMAKTGSQIYQLGVSHMWVDGLGYARQKGNDYSEWALTAFQDHLESLSSDELAEIGVSNPSTFDVRSHLVDRGIDPFSNVETPAIDAVYREYTLFHHRRVKKFLLELADRSRDGAPKPVADAGATFYGNLGGLSAPMPVDIYASDAADTVAVEADPTVPPERANDVTVKVARAAGRFEKPVRLVGKLHKIREMDTLTELDPTKHYPTLMAFQVAQSYAHGGVRGLSLTSWADVPDDSVVNNWVHADGSIDDSLQEFTDFVRSHERLLDDVREANRAVLAVSLPTLIWQRAPQWEQYVPDHSRAVRAAAAVLRREHIPYDVVVLDHPELWEAPEQYQRLADYDLVVLPGVECVSDAHVSALEAAVGAGTTITATGGGPSRNLEYQPRDDVQTLLREAESATIVESDPTANRDDSGTRALHDALPSQGRQVELGTDADVSVNVMGRPDQDTLIVHLLNFEYDPDTDLMASQTDLDVTVRDLPFAPQTATYHTVSGPMELAIEGDQSEASVVVHQLDVWGFVTFSASGSTAEEGDESTAAERLAAARAAVEGARADERTRRLPKAEAALSNAERAFDYGAYSNATSIADEAIDAAERAYRTPVIGVDTAHSQSEATYDASLSQLQETFDAYDYRDVSAWTGDGLEGIDVLVVPALDAESGASFDVGTDELNSLEAFVRGGGSLLILGMSGAKPGLNDVAGRFEFEFDLRPVLQEIEGDLWAHEVESPLSAVTQFVPRWGARFGTVLSDVGDATVLGRVAPNQSAWLHDQGPLEQRADDEPDATGKPVMAGMRVGDGHVVVSGESQQFIDPATFDGTYPAPLPENLLRVLGHRARYQRRSVDAVTTTRVETSATTRQNTNPGTAPQQTTTDGMAGFTGPVTALAGSIAALRYVWTDVIDKSE